MKKIIKFFCVLSVFLFLVTIDNVKATSKNGTETFNVNVSSKTNIQSGAISLTYDREALSLESASWLVISPLIQDFNKETNDGVFAYTSGQTIGGDVFTMTFKVKESAKVQKYEIKAEVKLVDVNNQSSTQTKIYTIDVECTHSFTKEVVDDKYLKQKASCASPATYYKSCEYCGLAGATTFTSGDKKEHTFDEKIENSLYIAKYGTCTTKTEYYYACRVCGAKGTETYIGSAEPTHTFSEKWYTDKDSHWHECDRCIAESDKELHTPGPEATEYTPQTCTTCGYVIKAALGHEHNFDVTKYITDDKNHWYECSCGEKAEVKAHTYDSECDVDCNGCGYERVVEHTFGEWLSDDNNHWKECNCGEKSELANHTPGPEATNDTPQTCTTCGYVIKAALSHEHKFGTTYKYNEDSHWYECECGEKSGENSHEYSTDCDDTCDVCGSKREVTHNFGKWLSDEENHWKECSCGEKSELANHTPGPEATTDTPQTCTVCNHILNEVHTHKFDNGVTIEEATTKTDGLIKYSCDCGYEKFEVVPKLPKKGCKKDLSALVVGLISLSMLGVLLKKKEK